MKKKKGVGITGIIKWALAIFVGIPVMIGTCKGMIEGNQANTAAATDQTSKQIAPLTSSPSAPAFGVSAQLGAGPYIGDTFTLGDFRYRITRFSEKLSVGNRFTKERASSGSLFLVVDYEESNLGSESATVLSDAMKLKRGDRTYAPSTRGMTALAMSGRADLALSQIHPGVTRKAQIVFEVPDAVTRDPWVLEVPERGFLGTGKAAVTLRTKAEDWSYAVSAAMGPEVMKALRERDYGAVKALLAPSAADAVTDDAITRWADRYNHALDNRGKKQMGIRHGDSTLKGDMLTYAYKFVPKKGRWKPKHGKVDVVTKVAGDRVQLVDIVVSP